MRTECPIDDLAVRCFRVPTDAPESDGTLEWNSTILVLVTVRAGDCQGLGYTYADRATARLIYDTLRRVVIGRDGLAISGSWDAMVRAIRNLGRAGVAPMAIAAVDAALWDLKAKLLAVPLHRLIGKARDGVPIYGSGGFTSYSVERLQKQLGDWVADGISSVKMKVGREPRADVQRVRAARQAIGEAHLFVDANGAYGVKEALGMADAFAPCGVTWFEEPVSSDDLAGLRLLRDRAPAGMAIAAGEYGYEAHYFRRMLEAGAVYVLQADATRCAGITGFLRIVALADFHDHVRIERMLFEGAVVPQGGELRPEEGHARRKALDARKSAPAVRIARGRCPETGGREDAVKDALALCLSCKGCKGDCPVHVDMATYKAEFLSHYYEGRPRPRTAYAFGLIDLWSAMASRAPGLANLVTQTPGLRALAKTAAGIAPARRIPAFAAETFQQWWHRAGNPVGIGERVLLWPDTFNNHFLPDTACAAVDVLGAGGFSVQVPKGHVCCGRPLYEFGMLDLARARLEKILERFAPQIDAGIPILVLEPACASVFRDELKNLLPEHPRAKKLAEQTYFFGEFVDRHADRFDLRLERDAVAHRHCNENALVPERAGAKVLERMGVTARFLDSGCCGMAGSFGFERDKYDVSLAIAGDRLLPAIQDCNENALLIADGYSCREQIAQTSARQAMHLAQVMQIALRPELVSMNAPIEQRITERRRRQLAGLRGRTLLTLGGIALGAALWHFIRDQH